MTLSGQDQAFILSYNLHHHRLPLEVKAMVTYRYGLTWYFSSILSSCSLPSSVFAFIFADRLYVPSKHGSSGCISLWSWSLSQVSLLTECGGVRSHMLYICARLYDLIKTFTWTGINTNSSVLQPQTYPAVSFGIIEEVNWPLVEGECSKFSIWSQLQNQQYHTPMSILPAISNPAVLLILNSLSSQR